MSNPIVKYIGSIDTTTLSYKRYMSSIPTQNKFWDFIADKYKDEYDDFNADDGALYAQPVVDYLNEWYDNMSCNIDRRWVDVNELMMTSITEDGWELYEYNATTDSFDEVDWEACMAGWTWTYNKKGERVSKFSQFKDIYVAKYYQ